MNSKSYFDLKFFFLSFLCLFLPLSVLAAPDPADMPNVLLNNPQESQSYTGECTTSLIAGTNFSSSSKTGVYSYTINDIDYIEGGSEHISIPTEHEYVFDNGGFQASNADLYSIVSNPKVLNANYKRITDGKNRLVMTIYAPQTGNGDGKLLFTYKLQNLKIGSDIKIEINFEDLCPGCSSEPQKQFMIRANCVGNDWAPAYNQMAADGYMDGVFSCMFNDIKSSTLSFSVYARFWQPCHAIAISDIKVYSCVEPTLKAMIDGNSAPDGSYITISAEGFLGSNDDYYFYRSADANADANGTWVLVAGPTSEKEISVLVNLGTNYFKVVRGLNSATVKVFGDISCSETGGGQILFKEDFGTTTKRTNNSIIDKIGVYTYQPIGKVDDNYYCVVSNLDQADPSLCGWPGNKTDHTGNDENGAFLVINAGTKLSMFYEISLGTSFCTNRWYNMSLYAANLATSSFEPAEFKFEVVTSTGTVVESWETGPIIGMSEEDIPLKWHKYGISFIPESEDDELFLKIYSTSNETQGNDFALDDIVVSVCSPDISLYADAANKLTDVTVDCGTEVRLETVSISDIHSIFEFPYYLWQESKDGINWINVSGEQGQGVDISDYEYIPRSSVPTYFRVIVAINKDVAQKVANGDDLGACDVYVISNIASVQCTGCENIETPTVQDYEECSSSGSLDLNDLVTSDYDNGTLNWYDSNGNMLSSTIIDLSSPISTTYFVTYSEVNGSMQCESEKAEVNIKITPITAKPTVDTDAEGYAYDECAVVGSKPLSELVSSDKSGLKWYDESGIEIDNPVFDTAAAGEYVYYVTKTNPGECESEKAEVRIRISANSSRPVVTDYDECAKSGTYSLSDLVMSDKTNLEWFDSNMQPLADATFDKSVPGNTTYYVRNTVSGECSSEAAEVHVNIKDQAVASDITADDMEVCTGASATLTAATSITDNDLVFTWYDDADLQNVVGTGATLQINGPEESKTYYVTVKGANTCENLPGDAAEADVYAIAPIDNIRLEPVEERIGMGKETEKALTVEPTDAYYTAVWTANGQVIADPDSYFPAKPYDDVEYKVVVTDECGNEMEASAITKVVWPTIITPQNVDGKNDDFLVGMQEDIHLEIFDRWGNVVYSGNDGWHQSEAAQKMPGVYYYIATLPDGSIKKGTVEIYK